MSLDELYKDVILDHYQHPRNRGQLEAPDVATRGHNPLCGDEILLSMNVDHGTVSAIAFSGRGCSISQASASMMTESVKGQSLEHAERLAQAVRAILAGEGSPDALGAAEELQALQGVKRYPVRIKCALLPWTALEEALQLYQRARSEER